MPRCTRCNKFGLFLHLYGTVCEQCLEEINTEVEAAHKKKKSISTKRRTTTRSIPKAADRVDIDLAEQVMHSLVLSFGIGATPSQKEEVKKITAKYKTQGKIAAYASLLCGVPTTPKGYYIKSWACEFAGAAFRQETIKWSKKWIECGTDYPGIPKLFDSRCSSRNLYLSDAYQRLGIAYEGEYMFEEAMDAYNASLRSRPDAAHLLIFMARVYTKMNRIDDAILLLEKTPFLHGETKAVRRETLKELREKKQKGYVYRPRKKKQ